MRDSRVRHRDQDEPAPARRRPTAQAVMEGLRDGTIDCIATDHAPHTVDDKKVEYDQAAFGIVGAGDRGGRRASIGWSHAGMLELEQLVSLLSTGPARVLGLPGGTLRPALPRDVTVLDPGRKRQVEPEALRVQGPQHALRGLDAQGLAGDDGGGGPGRLRRPQLGPPSSGGRGEPASGYVEKDLERSRARRLLEGAGAPRGAGSGREPARPRPPVRAARGPGPGRRGRSASPRA